ncbi:MAG: single-stranded-DNA-specific exonuclease RecJ [Phycisphaeraceae bacterium]|nr:single-stranded-DNA-specific exonuclease RecJ [Phycisphaeraceae bacterium]
MWRCRSAPGSRGGLLDRVLAARGVLETGAAEAYLRPALTGLHDPSGIPDLDCAAVRIIESVRAREPIVIYADYDVDGTSAAAILFHMIRALDPEARVTTYVPHRLEEGYGLNVGAIEALAAEGARLIVSVDCGVTAIEPALAAVRLGVDLIITDHHTAPSRLEDLPRAHSVVHPGRPDSEYPFGDLCGAGVAYKLAWRLATTWCGSDRVTDTLRTLLVELLALASLGTVADVVPLIGENRIITAHGLRRIRSSPLAGLRELVDASGLDSAHVSSADVGFRLGPRLNACGRLGHAAETIELLTTATGERAAQIARELTRLNERRRTLERSILEQATELADRAGMLAEGSRAIVLADARWHAGVVGIVCSRLVERFCRPVILMQTADGVCKGSGRSVEGFDLHAAVAQTSSLLESFGGHRMAVGLSLSEANRSAFEASFAEVARRELHDREPVGVAEYDAEAGLSELSLESVRDLQRMEPFGRGNPAPVVRVRSATLEGRARVLGRAGDHLALRLSDQGRSIRVVGWNWGARRGELPPGSPVEVLIRPRVSSWSGRQSVEGELVDLRIATRG